jgi:F-box interacting protein
VCNPAIKSWVVLPESSSHVDDDEQEPRIARLGFDPVVSLHFHVFEFVNEYGTVAGIEIYSSESGAWTYKESKWGKTNLWESSPSVFLNGLLHFSVIQFNIVAFNVEGESWWLLPVPEDRVYDDDEPDWIPGFLSQYQGQLCYMNACDTERDLSIWVKEDYGWVLKHQVTIQQLTEKISPPKGLSYRLITIHPDCN